MTLCGGESPRRIGNWTWPRPSRGRAPMRHPEWDAVTFRFMMPTARVAAPSKNASWPPNLSPGAPYTTGREPPDSFGSYRARRPRASPNSPRVTASPAHPGRRNCTRFPQSRGLIPSPGRQQKKQDSQAQRLRDLKIEDRLCLGQPEHRLRQLGFFLPFLSDKIRLARAYPALRCPLKATVPCRRH
jgi:hypothetical protein